MEDIKNPQEGKPFSRGEENSNNENSQERKDNSPQDKHPKPKEYPQKEYPSKEYPPKDNHPKEGSQKDQTTNQVKGPYLLRNKFRLSFRNPNDNITNMNYGQSLIKIRDIESIEDFWNYYCHIYRPQDLQSGFFYLFLSSVQPMWEDEANKGGGRFNIKMRKGYVNKIWEDLVVGFLGETCEDKDLLTGLVLQIKQEQDIIQLWVKEIPKHRHNARSNIQMWIAETTGLDPAYAASTFAYQPHQRENTKPHSKINAPLRKF